MKELPNPLASYHSLYKYSDLKPKTMSNQDLHIYHHLTLLPYLTYTHYLIG